MKNKVKALKKNDDPVQSLTRGIICMQLSSAFKQKKFIRSKCNHHSELCENFHDIFSAIF